MSETIPPIASAAWPLQKSLFNALKASQPLQALLGPDIAVYDTPPAHAPFPYLTLGTTRMRAYDGIDHGVEHDFSINIYSRYAGRREIKQIIDATYETLHDAEFNLIDHCLASLRFVFADAFQRTDINAYQGLIRFRALTHPLMIPPDNSTPNS